MMLVWQVALLSQLIKVLGEDLQIIFKDTHLKPMVDLQNQAAFGDGQNRGPVWYSDESKNSPAESDTAEDASTLSDSKSVSITGYISSECSSKSTDEHMLEKRKYRTCTPCYQDMLKKHTNTGIKWICAAYQRARRTFKSICMMRYRNCQDGTMFVKIYDRRCPNDTYHGRHWFYVYRV